MPLYEYQCDACTHRFEVIQKFSDAPVDTCPKCGAAVRKLLSSPAIQFKGTGWYITDYARSGKSEARTEGKREGKGEGKGEGEGKGDTAAPAAGDKAAATPAAGSESKTESKAASKPESKPAAP